MIRFDVGSLIGRAIAALCPEPPEDMALQLSGNLPANALANGQAFDGAVGKIRNQSIDSPPYSGFGKVIIYETPTPTPDSLVARAVAEETANLSSEVFLGVSHDDIFRWRKSETLYAGRCRHYR